MNEMSKKEIILDYLLKEYEDAKSMNNVDMMCRLFRAIVAFDYDKHEEYPDWNVMVEAYLLEG